MAMVKQGERASGKQQLFSPAEARKLLRGSGKGERLTERLLKSRADDIKYESRYFPTDHTEDTERF